MLCFFLIHVHLSPQDLCLEVIFADQKIVVVDDTQNRDLLVEA